MLTAAFRPEALTWFFSLSLPASYQARRRRRRRKGNEKRENLPAVVAAVLLLYIIYFGVVLQEVVGTVPHGHQLRSARDTVRSAISPISPIKLQPGFYFSLSSCLCRCASLWPFASETFLFISTIRMAH